MQYNRDMLSNVRQQQEIRKANKNVVVKFTFLMNELHSCEQRYFPSKEKKAERIAELTKAINEIRGKLPKNIRAMIGIWLNDRDAWLSSVDSIHFNV